MATTLITRETTGGGATVKNAPLTNAEVDNNFISLADNKVEIIEGTVAIIPTGTTGERPGTPSAGMLRFNTTESVFEGFNGAEWGSIAGGGGGISYTFHTSNYTTTAGEGVLADTTGGSFTVTLPASPEVGDTVVVADAGGAWNTNNLTIARNGSTIENDASDLVADIDGVSITLIYDGTTWETYSQVGAAATDVVTVDNTVTMTNKTLENPILTLGGTEGTAGQFIISQGVDQSPVFVASSDLLFDSSTSTLNANVINTTDGVSIGGTQIVDTNRNLVNISSINNLSYPTSDGAAGQFLATDGSGNISFVSAEPGLKNITAFTSSGTWTRPADVTRVKVTVVGGGSSGNKGAGGTAIKFIDVSSVSSVSVVVGAGGTGGTGSQSSPPTLNDGGDSSFGSFCTATGGGSFPGVGQNGDVNISGGEDSLDNFLTPPVGEFNLYAPGGTSIYGNGGPGSAGYLSYRDSLDSLSYGSGKDGIVIIEEYS